MTYPEDCLQSLIEPEDWWEPYNSPVLSRGVLVRTFISHFDESPYTLNMKGRTNPEEHGAADLVVAPLRVGQPLDTTALPVAGMTQRDGEYWTTYRAKMRPCLVLANNSPRIERKLTLGKPNHSTAPTVVIAPFYGIASGKRAGYLPQFVERVRHCEWPQFFWDHLPIKKGEESILRFDQMRPMGMDSRSYQILGFKLSELALQLMDELLQWYLWDGVEEDSYLAMYREHIENTFPNG